MPTDNLTRFIREQPAPQALKVAQDSLTGITADQWRRAGHGAAARLCY